MADGDEGKRKKKRRPYGTGGIHQRKNGLWMGSVDLGRRPDGKRDRRSVYGKTKKDVEEKIQGMLTDHRRGQLLDPVQLTVAEYMAEWLESTKPPIVTLHTWVYYEQHVRVHIVPVLGHIKLTALTPIHIQHLYQSRLDMGRSPRTVTHIHEVLRNALGQAVEWRLLQANPADGVKRPKLPRRSDKMQFLTFEEAGAWLRSLQGDPLESLHLTAIMTGMRQGELLGLRWSDIDFETGTITVAQTVWIYKRQVTFNPPKDKETRDIPIPPTVVAKLRSRRKNQEWEMRMAGDKWTDYGLVWTRDNGLPLRHEYVRKEFYRSLKAADLRRIRFHDLRHSAATLLLALGASLVEVSEWLGHASVEITGDLYSHVLPDAHRKSALKLEEKLLKQNESTR